MGSARSRHLNVARQTPLKVFRTPIGFHDAYVAATSRKNALAAWGAEKDLFASGSAEIVTDPELTARPLASPGQVIKVSRGTIGEHLHAAKSTMPRQGTARPTEERPSKPPRAPKRRPSRGRLDQIEMELRAFEAKTAHERAQLDQREAELLRQRKTMNIRHRREADKIHARLDRARAGYEAAMDHWRKD